MLATSLHSWRLSEGTAHFVSVVILLSDYSKIRLGLKLLPADSGVVMGLEVGASGMKESFMSLILKGMSLLRFVRDRSCFSCVLHLHRW